MRQQDLFREFAAANLPVSQLSIAVEILIIYNCRASEVLSASWGNLEKGHRLVLRGKKRSSNIIVTDRILLKQIESLPRLDEELIFPSLNYYHLYRYCKQHYSHLFVKWKKKKNYKVTHGFRYRAVEKVANDEIIRDILHHRSAKSGKFYKLK